MTDQRDADFLEVLGSQALQDLGIDRVVAKRRYILLEAQIPQPIGDIKRHRQHSLVVTSVVDASLE